MEHQTDPQRHDRFVQRLPRDLPPEEPMKTDFYLARARTEAGKEIKEGGVGETIKNHGGGRLTTDSVLSSVQIPLLLRTVEFIEAWQEWIEHRLECGRKYRWPTTIRCFTKAMKECEAIGSERAVRMIDHSISMCYRFVFEPRKFHREQPETRVIHGTVFSRATPKL